MGASSPVSRKFIRLRGKDEQHMSETTTSDETLRSMTPQAVEAAARADRDAQPLTPEDLKRMKRTPQAKVIARALALKQEEGLTKS
jgi:hypothetical protein